MYYHRSPRILTVGLISMGASWHAIAQPGSISITPLCREWDQLSYGVASTGASLGRARSLTARGPHAFAAVLGTHDLHNSAIIWGKRGGMVTDLFGVLQMPAELSIATPSGTVVQQQLNFESTCGVSSSGTVLYSSLVLSDPSVDAQNNGTARTIDVVWQLSHDPLSNPQ